METESIHGKRNPLASTTDLPGLPVIVHKKRGRPPKKKNIPKIIITKTIPDKPVHVEKPVEIIPPPPKKRGRPRKVINPAPKEETPHPLADIDAERDVGPAQRLRSRTDPVTPNTNPLSGVHLALKQSGTDNAVLHSRKNKRSGPKDLKVGKPRSSQRQMLAQVPRCDVKEPVSSVDVCKGQKLESDEQGKINPPEQKVDVNDVEGSQICLAGMRKIQRRKRGKRALPRTTSPSKMIAGSTSQIEMSACQSNLVSSQRVLRLETEEVRCTNGHEDVNLQSNVSSSDALEDPKTEIIESQKCNKPDITVNVKSEDIEIELDDFDAISASNRSSQHNLNTVIKSEPSTAAEIRETEITNFSTDEHLNSMAYNTSATRRKRRKIIYGRNKRRRKPDLPLQGELLETSTQERKGTVRKNYSDPSTYPNGVPRKRRGKVKCKDCGKIFKYYSHYVIHHRTHTGEKPYKCEECGKCFHKSSNLNLHIKTHIGKRVRKKPPDAKIMTSVAPEKQVDILKCKCGKTFRFRSALIRHMRVHTGERPFKCNICGQGFGQSYAVYIHELTHWNVKCYGCTICGKSFTEYKNAKDHLCLLSGKQNAQLAKRKQARASLSYTCHICSKTFFQLKAFTHHFEAHTGSKYYRCLSCDRIFAFLSDFDAHRSICKRTSGESSTSCSVKNELTNESISVSCATGVISKNSKRSLEKQKQTSAKTPFQSTGTQSPNLSHLVSKLNKLDNRSDPRRYLCPSCGRLFRHMGRLRAHMLTHPRGRSYSCSFCGKMLENWNKLWRHQRIHRQKQGRFTCPQCGQGFRFVEAYKRHMDEHPEFHWVQVRPKRAILPYQCEQCNACFRTLDFLFSHQLCHFSLLGTQNKPGYKMPVNDNTRSIRKVTSLSTKQNVTTKSELKLHNVSHSQTDMDGDLFSNCRNAVPTEPRADKQPSSTRLYKEKKTIPEEMLNETPVDRQDVPDALDSNSCDGSSGAIKCALCDSAYSAISDLYQHYLQHARGQL